ncbi:hypothetical protein LguiA_029237 [Lonicera macranthoides]
MKSDAILLGNTIKVFIFVRNLIFQYFLPDMIEGISTKVLVFLISVCVWFGGAIG